METLITPRKLLTTANPKTEKGRAYGYSTAVLHLAPHMLSGYNTCPRATAGCIAGCLNTAGRGGIFKRGETTNAIQRARIARTRFLFEDPEAFRAMLEAEILGHIARAHREGLKAAIRLNGTSDIAWESPGACPGGIDVASLMDDARARGARFFDYTKYPARAERQPYPLTYSRSEKTADDRIRALARRGVNTAVVFDRVPDTYLGLPVINGDAHDLRFLDPSGVIIGLKAKGRARKDASGFVVRGVAS